MELGSLHDEDWEYVRTLLPGDLEESAYRSGALLRCRNISDAACFMRIALAYAVCTALRLARFNASLDTADQPRKSAGYLTGVPAPAGAGMLLLPIFLWLASDGQWDWLL